MRIAIFALLVPLIAALPQSTPAPAQQFSLAGSRVGQIPPRRPGAVHVQLGVMSQCPDALLCEAVFDRVLDSVSAITDLELVFIGARNSSAEYGATCKHGDGECHSNIVELCVASHWATDEKSRLLPWNFVQCLNYKGLAKVGEEKSAVDCAKCLGQDWEDPALQGCITGDEGRQLLLRSLEEAQRLSVTKSCTVVIEGEQACIVDGGVWKDCPAGHTVPQLVKQIRAKWDEMNG